MTNPEPNASTRIVRETFIDMAIRLECLFLLYEVNDILADNIIHCMEEGYVRAMKNLKRKDLPKKPLKREPAVDRFLRKLELEKI